MTTEFLKDINIFLLGRVCRIYRTKNRFWKTHTRRKSYWHTFRVIL